MNEKQDLISRQAAIDALAKHEKSNGHNYTLFVDIVSECAELIRDLPSAQQEIIRCEYCAHRNQYRFPPKYDVRDHCEVHEKVTTLTNFCSWAERKDNG